MCCSQLQTLKNLSMLTLEAGAAGLNREISWLYFADTLESVDNVSSPDIWIDGNELFVVTHPSILNDIPKMCRMMEVANHKQAAGFIMEATGIRPEYITLADELKLPLFSLPKNLRTVDLSQILCTALIEERNAEGTLEKLLLQLLHGNLTMKENILYNASLHGIDLQQPFRVAIFDIENFQHFLQKHNIAREESIDRIRRHYLNSVRSQFESATGQTVMSTIEDYHIVTLIPTKTVTRETFHRVVDEIHTDNIYYRDIALNISVGCEYSQLNQISRSFAEATRLASLIPVLSPDHRVLYYEDAEFYSLILFSDNKDYLKAFHQRTLGELIRYDQVRNTQLVETLAAFCHNNGHISAAADELFIHRNTLRYRLEKISSILQADLSDYNTLTNLIIALKVGKYLNLE
ncbi:MAG: helix-turn-helix domain-containing protein [Clostridiales bacterium]|nr:helix-turn-helix domain-containing protein [Clostridiales bacterium]